MLQYSNPMNLRFLTSILAGTIAYILLNYRPLIEGILYRWAAGDAYSAITNGVSYALQFAVLYLSVLVVTDVILYILIVLILVSAFINIGYADLLGSNLDPGALLWLFAEVERADTAILEYPLQLSFSFMKVLLAGTLIICVRRVHADIHPILGYKRDRRAHLIMAALLISNELFIFGFQKPRGNEFSFYSSAFKAFNTDYPLRDPVPIYPSTGSKVNKVIWLIDESVGYEAFKELSSSLLLDVQSNFKVADVGPAVSLGNCSAQSNAALRWGINVERLRKESDLRSVPPIWSYARSAGFNTVLIDGQVNKAPQNLIWPPELALIDQFIPALSGIDTDKHIAALLNKFLPVHC